MPSSTEASPLRRLSTTTERLALRDPAVRSTAAIGDTVHVTRIVIVGGGPAGYEAALVARQLEADVTVVDRDGVGGACVLTDCVPSKTLIATSEVMTGLASAGSLGVRLGAAGTAGAVDVDLKQVNARVKALAV